MLQAFLWGLALGLLLALALDMALSRPPGGTHRGRRAERRRPASVPEPAPGVVHIVVECSSHRPQGSRAQAEALR